jgi:hypothetical protein
VLDLLVEHFLDTFTHCRDEMIRAIKGNAVAKDQADIVDEFLGVIIPRILLDEVGLCRIRRS